jgi:hypothetical protein
VQSPAFKPQSHHKRKEGRKKGRKEGRKKKEPISSELERWRQEDCKFKTQSKNKDRYFTIPVLFFFM